MASCEHPSAQIERKLVESHALALVYRNCPCQFQRILGEGTCQLLLHLTFFLVIVVAIRFPRAARHNIRLAIVERDAYLVLGEFGHLSERTVCPTFLQIVACEHHLCTNFQAKFQFYRKTLLLESSVNSTFVHELLCFNLLQSLKVNLVSSLVDGS